MPDALKMIDVALDYLKSGKSPNILLNDYFTTTQVIDIINNIYNNEEINDAFKQYKHSHSRIVGDRLRKYCNDGKLLGTKKDGVREWYFKFSIDNNSRMDLIKKSLKNFCPEYILQGNGSIFAFGEILSLTGGKGLCLPMEISAYMGVKEGNGNVKYLVKKNGDITTDTTFLSVNRIIKRGDTFLPERYCYDELNNSELKIEKNHGCNQHGYEYNEFDDKCMKCEYSAACEKKSRSINSYLKVLRRYDYCICFETNPKFGFGMIGVISIFLATVAFIDRHRTDILQNVSQELPNNNSNNNKFIWNCLTDIVNQNHNGSISLNDIFNNIKGRKPERKNKLIKIYFRLCQAIEEMINTDHDAIDISKGKKILGFKTFSSCGSSLTTLLGKPIMIKLKDDGTIDYFNSKVLSNIPRSNLLGLVQFKIEDKSTAESLQILIDNLANIIPPSSSITEFTDPKEIIDMLIPLNNYIVEKVAKNLIKINKDIYIRRGIISMMRLHHSIYKSLGVYTGIIDSLGYHLNNNNGHGISLVGLGKDGIALICHETNENVEYFNSIINYNPQSSQKFNSFKPLYYEEFCFTSKPLKYIKVNK